jgi:predicted alpha/beta superfamily hydrolase
MPRKLSLPVLILLLGICRSSLALAGQPEPVVIGSSLKLESAVYGGDRTLVVWLPPGYQETDARYPVLYVIDGGVHQDFIPMAGLAMLGPLTGQYRTFILVGVQTENRYHELTVRSEIEEELELIPDCGGAAPFRRHLLEEVKPHVEASYRTSGEDAVIGESLAGLFITETFLRAPRSFTHYVAVSPSLWWRGMALSMEAPALLQAPGFPADRSFYLTVADEGGTMNEGVERLAGALADQAPAGLRWWYEPLPDEQHHTIYNPASLRALRLVFAPRDH